jgi:hypothetical protein
MKHTVTYQIEGGLKHTWTTKNRIETATLNNELIFSAKQKEQQKCILEMMRLLVSLTKKHGIKIFAISGTLLGAKRNGGLIPYDDDGDFGFEMSEYKKLLKLTKMDIHPKYKLVYNNNLDKGFHMLNKSHPIAHIDLFAFGTDQDPNKIVHISPIADGKPTYYTQYIFPKDWMDKSCIEHLEWVDFEDFKIPIPSDSINQLHHIYDKNCMTTYVPDARNHMGINTHNVVLNNTELMAVILYNFLKFSNLLQLNKSNDRKQHFVLFGTRLMSELSKMNFEQTEAEKLKRIQSIFTDYLGIS